MKTTFSLTDLHVLGPRDRWATDRPAVQAATNDRFNATGHDRTSAGAAWRWSTVARRGWFVRIDSTWLLGSFGAQVRQSAAEAPALATNPDEAAWRNRAERSASHKLPDTDQPDPSMHRVHDPQRPDAKTVTGGRYSCARP